MFISLHFYNKLISNNKTLSTNNKLVNNMYKIEIQNLLLRSIMYTNLYILKTLLP
mgnify:CR=1 FL=1